MTGTIALTHIQRLIGRRMLSSKREKPCFYITARADVTGLMASRGRLRKSLGVKVTTNAFYIRALAAAAAEMPIVMGRLDGDFVHIPPRVNVGFAVNAPHGLVVPVVKAAEVLGLAETAEQEQVLTELARSGRLTLEQLEGETIGLSNLGLYGMDSFLGIVPPPASTILAVGNVLEVPRVVSGRVEIRRVAVLSVAADARIASPASVAAFLERIVAFLEGPVLEGGLRA